MMMMMISTEMPPASPLQVIQYPHVTEKCCGGAMVRRFAVPCKKMPRACVMGAYLRAVQSRIRASHRRVRTVSRACVRPVTFTAAATRDTPAPTANTVN